LSFVAVAAALTTLRHCQMTDELMPVAAAVEMIALVAHSSRSMYFHLTLSFHF
jgi:hypothetical protein